MRPLKQANRHDPANGLHGDCHRTCLAMMLDMERDAVPNYAEQAGEDWILFHQLFEDWLNTKGYATFNIAFAADFDDVMRTMRHMNPGTFYLLGGTSRNGTGHSVVCINNKILADPSLDNSGIVGPMSDGYFYITILIPANQKANLVKPDPDPEYAGRAESAPEPCPECGNDNPAKKCIGCRHKFEVAGDPS